MLRPRRARTALAAALAWLLLPALLGFAVPAARAAAPSATASAKAATPTMAALRVRAVYFERTGSTSRRDLAVSSMAALSPFKAELWRDFLASWDLANKGLKVYTTIPKGLPAKGHAFVVLGSALSKAGAITAKIKRRLKLAVAALKAYPKSKVLVSGGAPRNGHTEAAVMRHWLIVNGVARSRILTESTSASTVSNANNSMTVLHTAGLTSYTLVSDASHIRRSTILFNAARVRIQEHTGEPWAIRAVANLAFPDSSIASRHLVPPATHKIIASNVASIFGQVKDYQKLLASPPAKPRLSSIRVVAPKTLTYEVGQGLSTDGLVVTALYDGGFYSRPVTGSARITGFTSSEVGPVEVTVSYAASGVTKSARFGVKIVKAAATMVVKRSTLTVRKDRTRLTVKVTLTASDPKLVPTGIVKFYLDGKRVRTRTLHADDAGVARFTYPKIGKLGDHEIKVRYLGDAQVGRAERVLISKVIS